MSHKESSELRWKIFDCPLSLFLFFNFMDPDPYLFGIRIHKAAEYEPNLDSDPQRWWKL